MRPRLRPVCGSSPHFVSCHLLCLPSVPQDLNPLPFPVLVGNCAGWVAYGFVTDDVLVLWPNVLGVLIA